MNTKYFFFVLASIIVMSCSAEQAGNTPSEGTDNPSSGSTSRQSPAQETVFISDTSAGDFYKGLFISNDLLEGLVEKTDKSKTGKDVKYYSYNRGSSEDLRINPAYDPRMEKYSRLVGSIVVKSNEYKDSKGISIGSKVSDFLSQYPDAYIYHDLASQEITMSDEGHGPQYIVAYSALIVTEDLNIGRIKPENINEDAKIKEIRIVRSKYENQDALANKKMEEVEILEGFLESICGNYYQEGFTERYYKIHVLQGEYVVSECFEDQCDSRGKIVSALKTKDNLAPLSLDGISGEMVPRWTLDLSNSGKIKLQVHDYNVNDDKWEDAIYEKADF